MVDENLAALPAADAAGFLTLGHLLAGIGAQHDPPVALDDAPRVD